MGWVWKNEPEDHSESPVNGFRRVENPNPRSDGDPRGSTMKVVKSQCRTEEVEPGKFLRVCERTEEILRESIRGRPAEVVQSNKEYTEEDVTEQVLRGRSFPAGSSERGPFDFPGLRSDVEAIEKDFNFAGLRDDIDTIERSFFSGIGRFFEAAEEMRSGFLGAFDRDSSSSASASNSRGVPIEINPRDEPFQKRNKPESGHVDLSGLARDV